MTLGARGKGEIDDYQWQVEKRQNRDRSEPAPARDKISTDLQKNYRKHRMLYKNIKVRLYHMHSRKAKVT